MNQKLLPIKGSERSLSFVRRRVAIAPNPKNKSGFSYENQIDLEATRVVYLSMVGSIPATPGSLVVYKKFGDMLIPVEVLRCDENLRQKFSRPKGDVHRFHLLLHYLNEGFDAVVVQLARPAS
jgi:hypothetical protein